MDIVNSKTTIVIENICNILHYQPSSVQRLLNDDHVQRLVKDQVEEFNNNSMFSILQSITCADLNNKRYILDGQHRVAAFKVLRDMKYPLNQTIPLVIYKTDSLEELKEYYVRINKHHPINPLEVTDMWFKYGKHFCVWFAKEYSGYVKNSEKTCIVPHINLRELMEYVKRMHVFERLLAVINNGQKELLVALTERIIELNNFMIQYSTYIKKLQLTSEFKKKLDKCYNKNNIQTCYLGIWRQFEWIEICIYLIQYNTGVESIDLSQFCNGRTKVTKYERYSVWQKRNGKLLEGKCFVCNNDLMFENMECGHIVPHIYNGASSLDNLEPICKTCNRDMGIMNLNEYKCIINTYQQKNESSE
ncbi:hypothetical protein QKU58_gp064 [Pyramimonas orientalis virus]|uniref:HNH nuclease domain-containing protein n=1 Tax=Pyramimonas orientalis virus 01B TaxID=3134525 RepID=A0A7M3UNK4_9VIRU|nr:hypothetical protein QKU58_gp064 [Pyramimonas orientalis virus]QOI90267.1 hypothetical protein HWQ62_00130 [Pyramimonas orientalis virus]